MTAFNLYNFAKSGRLGENGDFPGYCVAGAIDACFDLRDVPLEVYTANEEAVAKSEVGGEGESTDNLYRLLGALVFKSEHPSEFSAIPYYFSSLEELRTDLEELRNKATILLDVNDGLHSVGLKPIGDNRDEWQMVGTDQIVAVMFEDGLDVQCMAEPETITTEQVWEYLCSNNSPQAEQQSALVFPPEPA